MDDIGVLLPDPPIINVTTNKRKAENSEQQSENNQAKQPKPNKRPFKGKSKEANNKGKRSIAKFEKQKEKSILFTTPLLTFFQLYTDFTGAILVSKIVYEILQARDHKMTNYFSLLDLQYTVLLATYLRAMTVANKSATAIIHGMSYLKDSVGSLLLPDVICSYIECFGTVKTAFDISVVPFVTNYRSMSRDVDFINPSDYLSREERGDAETEWSINDVVILRVQRGLSRALKGILELRAVKSDIEGKEELLGCGSLRGSYVQPMCFQKIDVNICSLGACFGFRDAESWYGKSGWHSELVHEAPAVRPDAFLTSWVLKQLKTPQK